MLFSSNSFWIDVVMGVKVSPADPSVLERDDRAVGQFLRTASVVQSVALESRLEEWTEMAVAVAAVIENKDVESTLVKTNPRL